MAKLSAIQKNLKRHKLVSKYSSKRAKLKKICLAVDYCIPHHILYDELG